jgi:hypothetical protein
MPVNLTLKDKIKASKMGMGFISERNALKTRICDHRLVSWLKHSGEMPASKQSLAAISKQYI